MAQFAFELNTNKTAQETGYDQYKTTLFESLGAIAADNWNYNPSISIKNYFEVAEAGKESRLKNIIPRDKKELNEEYQDLGLYFKQNEYQSVVDIIVRKKKQERRRQSIMERGPQGSFNPLNSGFYVGALKLGVGIGTSFVDILNIGASFIPIYGQARFARSIAKARGMGVKSAKAFRNARLKRGVAEGAVGATLLEPIVYGVAQRLQSDYDIYDSFMNVAFGSVLGGGLHVGAGKLKDMRVNKTFQDKILANRKNLSTIEGGKSEVDLYKEYYPELVADEMMKLDQTSLETKNTLLAKAIGDQQSGDPTNITDIINADPVLNGTSTKNLDALVEKARKNIETIKKQSSSIIKDGGKVNKLHLKNAVKKYNELLTERKKFDKPIGSEPIVDEIIIDNKKKYNELNVESTKQNLADLNPSQQDIELQVKEKRLFNFRTKQSDRGLDLEFDNKITRKRDTRLEEADKDLEEVNSKSEEIKDLTEDYINCTQGE